MYDLKGKIIGVDFDNTLAHYYGFKGKGVFGPPIESAAWAMDQLKMLGAKIAINTSRTETEAIKQYLKLHKIKFDYVNFSPKNTKNNLSPTKLGCDIYVDDRNVLFRGSWIEAVSDIKNFQHWTKFR